MKKSVLFALAAAVQVVAVLTIAARYEYVETFGKTVYIPVYGFDPRDVFRGDYASLSYGENASWTGTLGFEPKTGQTVYVAPELTSTGFFDSVKSVSEKEPSEFFVKAKVASYAFQSPTYGFESLKISSSVPLSESKFTDYQYISNDPSEAKFRIGTDVTAGVTSTGAVFALYADTDECVAGVRNGSWERQKFGLPYAPDNAEIPRETALGVCAKYPKVRITSVAVPRELRLDFGVDRLFVTENGGRPVENDLRAG